MTESESNRPEGVKAMQWFIKERVKAADEYILNRKYTKEEDEELHQMVIANWGRKFPADSP